MSAITLDEFRLRSRMSEAQLPRDLAIRKLTAATAMANRVANRIFGHAIESIVTSSSDVIIRVFSHGLPASGKVYLTGTGAAGLTGSVPYSRVDSDSIRVTGVTVPSTIEGQGMLSVPMSIDKEIVSNMVRITPGPVAAIEDIRLRASGWEDIGPYPDSSIIDPDLYILAKDGPQCWSGELELSKSLTTVGQERRAGLIRPMKSRTRRLMRVSFYAGCVEAMPEDIAEAIAAFTMSLAKDPAADKASESYEYYSYSRLTADEQRKLPTSAIATLLRYRAL